MKSVAPAPTVNADSTRSSSAPYAVSLSGLKGALNYTIPTSNYLTRFSEVTSMIELSGQAVWKGEESTGSSNGSVPVTALAPYVGQTVQLRYVVANESGDDASYTTDLVVSA